MSSFDVLEQLLAALVDRRRFPLLEHVTVVGHSAGGQTVHRFALASTFAPPSGVQLRFVVSNPSTFTYFDNKRWDNRSQSFKQVAPSVTKRPLPLGPVRPPPCSLPIAFPVPVAPR